MADCIFCKIISGEIPSNEVYSDDELFAFRDVNPQAPVHILIVPRKHIELVVDFTEQDAGLIGKMVLAANKIAESEGLVENGFRYVLNCNEHGGQAVFHVHLHVLGGRQMTWPPG
jgi:histidine triad (HIT) family protein